MLSITTKSPYALKALAELGHAGDRAPIPIGELARRREIPVPFLEQLFATLRRAGGLRRPPRPSPARAPAPPPRDTGPVPRAALRHPPPRGRPALPARRQGRLRLRP